MNIVLLSGGSGKRLWPLSNDIRSKQFIKIFKTEDGGYESMLQRVYRQIRQADPSAKVPVDPYVEDEYFKAVEELGRQAAKGEANLVLMGIHPTYPSENTVTISQGALWNGGVFACKLKYILDMVHELIGFENYAERNKISFGYAVVENEKKIQVMKYKGQWKDLGTWNTLTEAMEENSVGNAVIGNTCQNVHVINELNVPILTMGVADMVISASPEGILVSDKKQSSYIKPYVDDISQQVMFAEKSWGSFRVLDVENESMTIKVTLNPGCRMNYHSHRNRDEVWTVVSREGRTSVDGMEQKVTVGDVIAMEAGCRHTVIADTKLKLIEVQLGREISVDDKQKYPLE